MRRALSVIVLFGAATALADDKPLTAQDLERRGAVETASGDALQEPTACPRTPGSQSCEMVPGRFRELKLNDVEYVCFSFRGWTCAQRK